MRANRQSSATLQRMSDLTHRAVVQGQIDHPNYHWFVVCPVCGVVGDPTDVVEDARARAKAHAATNS
jgi:hypothetical protein